MPELTNTALMWADFITHNASLAVTACKTLLRSVSTGIDEETFWEIKGSLMEKVFSCNDAKDEPLSFAEKTRAKLEQEHRWYWRIHSPSPNINVLTPIRYF